MTRVPNKHYVSHKGHVFLQDVFVVTDGEKKKFFGRFGIMRSVVEGAQAEDVKITSMPCKDFESAFLATHNLMNESRKLGKCLIGYNPFDGKGRHRK